MLGIVLPWLAFTLVVYLFAFTGGFVATWGRDYTPTLRHFVTAFDIQRGNADVGAGLVFAGTAWNSLFTTLKLSALAAPLCAALGLADRLAAGANDAFAARQPVRVRARLLAFAIPGTVLGVSYILAFNVPPFELTGTGLIIVLSASCFETCRSAFAPAAPPCARSTASLDEASTMLARAAPRRRCAGSSCLCSGRRWWPRWSTASCAR